MPRVKDFEELPAWLQDSILRDWRNMHPDPTEKAVPPIRDPEYRVYRVDDPTLLRQWWAVDAGTGGVSIESEGESHAYDDLPDDSDLKWAVDAEGRRCRDAAHVNMLYEIIRCHGVDSRVLEEMISRIRADGLPDAEVVRRLAAALHAGLTSADWPK